MGYRRGASTRSYSDPKVGRVNILNGGTDAPLTPRGRRIYDAALVGIVVVAVILMAATWLARR